MQIISPETITDTVLTFSNVTEADHPVWAAGTTYVLKDRVIVLSTHRIYESLIASNLGNDPTTDDGTKWLNVSATNRWKAFDQRITDQTVNALSIEYKFTTAGITNGLALFGLDAATAQIIATSAAEGVVYDQTVSLVDNSFVNDYYAYFFEPIARRSEYVFSDLPNYSDTEIDLILAVSSGNASVGQVVIGQQRRLGDAVFGTTVSILDYSTNETDAFGNVYIVERAYSDTVDFRISVDTSRVGFLRRTLAGYRAYPIVWFEEVEWDYGTTVFGYYTSLDAVLDSPTKSELNLQVRGLT